MLDAAGNTYRADLCVWAAGIRAPQLLSTLGLPTNRGGQLEVDGWLRVKGSDQHLCDGRLRRLRRPRRQAGAAARPGRAPAGRFPAPDFPAAGGRQAGRSSKGYVYTDYGSLVSVGSTTSVGSLMGALQGFNWFVEGFFARMMYLSLHLMHHRAVLGTMRTGLLALARFLIRRTTPLVKLH